MKSRSLKEVALVTVPSENTGSDRCHVLARILNSDVRTLNMGNNVWAHVVLVHAEESGGHAVSRVLKRCQRRSQYNNIRVYNTRV